MGYRFSQARIDSLKADYVGELCGLFRLPDAAKEALLDHDIRDLEKLLAALDEVPNKPGFGSLVRYTRPSSYSIYDRLCHGEIDWLAEALALKLGRSLDLGDHAPINRFVAAIMALPRLQLG